MSCAAPGVSGVAEDEEGEMSRHIEPMKESSPEEHLEVIRTKREVIEGKLLAALDDEGKVAVLLGKDDLDLLILCTKGYADLLESINEPNENYEKLLDLCRDMCRLRSEAFGG